MKLVSGGRLGTILNRFRGTSFGAEFRILLKSITASMDLPAREFVRAMDEARTRFLDRVGRRLENHGEAALLTLKVLNLLLTKYEYQHQRINKLARPIGFMLDPSNGCQLGCPTCVNSFNRKYVDAVFNPWPKGMMKRDTFTTFIDDVGLFAFTGHFYNKHEPLLNKNTPAYVKRATSYRVETLISSNLSFPKLDIEGIVASGLKELMVAIDGVSQQVYSKYRRGGEVELVFANVRKIVEERRKTGLNTPYLRWQYLTFAHNVGEVEDAIETARSLGFDSFNLATPMDVSADEPTVQAVAYEGPEKFRQVVFNPYPANQWTSDLALTAPEILARLSESLRDRYEEIVQNDVDKGVARASDDYCDWLHLAVNSDAMGRIVPCCHGDYKGTGRFIFADVGTDSGRLLNTEAYRDARLLIVDPETYANRGGAAVRCQGCTSRPLPQVGLGTIRHYLMGTGSGSLRPWFDEELAVELCGWSRHKVSGPSVSQLSNGAIIQYGGEEGTRHEEMIESTHVTSGTIYVGHEVSANKIPCRGAVELVARVAYGQRTSSPIVGVTLLDVEGT